MTSADAGPRSAADDLAAVIAELAGRLAAESAQRAALTARVDAQADELARVAASLAAVEARGLGPRDAADRRLRGFLVAAVGLRTFTAGDVLRHAGDVPALRDALDDATITTPRELGQWLGRVAAGTWDGVVVECVGRVEAGRVWRCRPVDA